MLDVVSNAIVENAVDDAMAQALQSSLYFVDGPGHTRHVPAVSQPVP
jgi:hypothetical protein